MPASGSAEEATVATMTEHLCVGALSALLLIYLLYALIAPEKF